jgi:hypothetical protein
LMQMSATAKNRTNSTAVSIKGLISSIIFCFFVSILFTCVFDFVCVLMFYNYVLSIYNFPVLYHRNNVHTFGQR